MIQLQVPSFSTFVAGYLRWAVDLPGAWWRLLVLLVDHKGTTEREQSQIPFFLCFRLQTLRRFDTGSRRDFYRECYFTKRQMRYLCTLQCGFVITWGISLFYVNPLQTIWDCNFLPLSTKNVGVPLKNVFEKEISFLMWLCSKIKMDLRITFYENHPLLKRNFNILSLKWIDKRDQHLNIIIVCNDFSFYYGAFHQSHHSFCILP